MRQLGFEQQHRDHWERLRLLLDDLDRARRKRQHTAAELASLPKLYRELCNHYAIARSRHYSPALEQQLLQLLEETGSAEAEEKDLERQLAECARNLEEKSASLRERITSTGAV